MREKFWGYFPLTEQDFKEIIDDSYIIMDTNILLNFYRYTKATKDKLIEILGNKKERLFLLEIVLKEFFRNRYSAINDHCKGIEELKSKIGLKKIKQDINSFRHINLDKENLINLIEEFEEKLNNEFEKCAIIDFQKDDPILNTIMELFVNSIIPDFDDKKKESESKTAQDRYDKKIPPGFKDKNKDDTNNDFPKDEYRKYNDYFIWKQIINFAKEKEKNIIFVTDDVKEDWFRRNNGETRGPREELLNEFYKETNKKIYIYNTNGFFNAMDSEELTSDMIEEINEISDLNENDNSFAEIIYRAVNKSMNVKKIIELNDDKLLAKGKLYLEKLLIKNKLETCLEELNRMESMPEIDIKIKANLINEMDNMRNELTVLNQRIYELENS